MPTRCTWRLHNAKKGVFRGCYKTRAEADAAARRAGNGWRPRFYRNIKKKAARRVRRRR